MPVFLCVVANVLEFCIMKEAILQFAAVVFTLLAKFSNGLPAQQSESTQPTDDEKRLVGDKCNLFLVIVVVT